MAAIPATSAPAVASAPRRALSAAWSAASRAVSAVVAPHKASLVRLTEMPLVVLGTGLIDWSAFHVDQGVGLLVTGVSLWIVEHLIADDDDSVTP